MTHVSHEHHNHKKPFDKAFLISIVANGLFVILQLFYSYAAQSAGLFADAIHNLGDVCSLILAFSAERLLRKRASARRTYGLKKASILAALANGIFLVFSCGLILAEALHKWLHPTPIMAVPVMVVASLGIVINGLTALLFVSSREDLNIRAAFLHLLSDALVSAAVVVSALLFYWTSWCWLDPFVSIVIAVVILKGTWGLFRDGFRLILDGVPSGISFQDVRTLLCSQPGVKEVHDLHIWGLSTRENAMSVHLWMPEMPLTDEARCHLSTLLKEQYHIQHTTIQVEKVRELCHESC